jgi:hypothetical protein
MSTHKKSDVDAEAMRRMTKTERSAFSAILMDIETLEGQLAKLNASKSDMVMKVFSRGDGK